jgi:hypothetical protein
MDAQAKANAIILAAIKELQELRNAGNDLDPKKVFNLDNPRFLEDIQVFNSLDFVIAFLGAASNRLKGI